MICPACPMIGMGFGLIAGYFGVKMPEQRSHRILGAVITSAMIGVTVVALRCLFGITLCDGNGNFSLRNIAQVGSISIVMGIVYSIGVNILINLAVSALNKRNSSQETPPLAEDPNAQRPCCCEKKA